MWTSQQLDKLLSLPIQIQRVTLSKKYFDLLRAELSNIQRFPEEPKRENRGVYEDVLFYRQLEIWRSGKLA